jgi:alkylhydroperoxidase family enzyme
MARLPLLPTDPADPRVKTMFEEVVRRGVAVPNLYRVMAHAPEMLRAWLDFAWPLRLNANSPRRVRELVILRGAQVSKTAYEWAHHVPMALSAGVTQAEIDDIDHWREVATFTAAEKSALRLAEEVTEGPAASAECMQQLAEHFSPEEIVELVLTASFYVCVGRFLTSMAIELEPGYSVPDSWP